MLFPILEHPMPIYEYRCGKCGFQKEFLQRVSDAPPKKCPACGKSALSKLVTAAGFQLKGTGWYATDFKGGGTKPEAKKKDDKPAASSDKPADSASKDAAKPAAETKPAARAADASTN
jgi:putative FmdB family regulatory protein